MDIILDITVSTLTNYSALFNAKKKGCLSLFYIQKTF